MALPAATAALCFRGSVELESVHILFLEIKRCGHWNEFLSLAEVRETPEF